MSKFKHTMAVYWKINWLRRIIKVAIATLATLTLLPLILQLLFTHQIKKMGAHSANIDDIDLNLFSGYFQIRQLSFSRGNDAPAQLALLQVDLNMTPLFRGEIEVDSVVIKGFDGEIVRHKSGDITLNGITLLNIAPAQSPETDTDTPAETTETTPIKFALNRFTIINTQLHYRETDFDQRARIADLSLTNLNTWKPDQAMLLNSQLALNDADIELNLTAQLFSPERKFRGQLKTSEIKVQDYAKFYQDYLQELGANVTLQTDFDVRQGDLINADVSSTLKITGLKARYDTITQHLDSLDWQGQIRFMDSNQLHVAGTLGLLGSRSDLSSGSNPSQTASVRALQLNNLTLSSDLAKASSSISADLEISDIQAHYEQIKQHLESAHWQGHVDLSGPDQIKVKGALSLRGNRTHVGGASPQMASFGALNLSDFSYSMQASNANVFAAIDLSDLEIRYNNLQQNLQDLRWSGQATLSDNALSDLKGDLTLSGSSTRDALAEYQLATFESLSVNGLGFADQRAQVKSVSLSQLNLISDLTTDDAKLPQLLSVQALNVNEITYALNESQLNIDSIHLSNPDAAIILDPKRQPVHLAPVLNTLSQLQPEKNPVPEDATTASSMSADSPEAKPSAAASPFAFHITQLKLTQPGKIYLEDRGVSPVFKSDLHLNDIDISNLSPAESSDIRLALKLGTYTTIDIDGTGVLLDPLKSLQLDAKIAQLDLPPVTPYTSHAMGYGMKSGTVDTEIVVKLDQHNIDSVIDLKIDSIEVVETQKATAEEISSASGMSIDLAVSSLKDSDNVIELKIPVKGNVDKPDFDLSHIINNAMGKAMKAATLEYLKYTLQPFGSLVSLYKLAQTAANHIALPPIVFEANTTDFAEQQEELLNKVIKVLQDRPGLKLKACGISNKDDTQIIKDGLVKLEEQRRAAERLKQAQATKETQNAQSPSTGGQNPEKAAEALPAPSPIVIAPEIINQKARELADARASRVKQVLLEQGNLEPKRILNCLSSVQEKDKIQPSVELSL